MINSIKNIVVILLTASLILFCRLVVADMTLTTYYPSLSGSYTQFRFIPRSVDLINPCPIGTLYVNSSNLLQYCHDYIGSGKWGSVSDLWTQEIDNIYLTDTMTNPNLHVGIGTKTPELKLSLANDAGIIAKGNFGSGLALPNALGTDSRLIWYPAKAAFRAGYVNDQQWKDTNIGNYSVALGKDPKASGNYTVISGGDTNTASGRYSNIIGGQNNSAAGDYSIIGGGSNNAAQAQYTIISGGGWSWATKNFSTVMGGQANIVSEIYTTIGGGASNFILSPYSAINGGLQNTINKITGTVIGYSLIAGGLQNIARNDYNVISGGSQNNCSAPLSSIGGGNNNRTDLSAVGIGLGSYAHISGGQDNYTTASDSVISGGKNNSIAQSSASTSVINGGYFNTIRNFSSVIGAGDKNTVNGAMAVIMGGSDNLAYGQDWAEGKNLQFAPGATQTFAWGYSNAPVSITSSNAFIIAPGIIDATNSWNPKVGIRDINPTGVLEINANATSDDYINIKKNVSGDIFIVKNNSYIGINRAVPSINTYAMQVGTSNASAGNGAYLDGGGHWMNTSSRKAKENIQPLSSPTAQKTFENLNPVTFNYKANSQTNAGFIAEDVPEIVALNGRQALSAMDIIAVLTKVAQDQQIEIENQEQEIEKIQKTIKKLKRASQK